MTTETKAPAEVRTHLGMLLDESGSMGHQRDAVITGVNEFVSGLREDLGGDADVAVTLATFQTDQNPMVRPIMEGKQLGSVDTIGRGDFAPSGLTPLYDAVGQTIRSIEREFKKGEKAMVVIFTDGKENASREFDQNAVTRLIADKEAEGWVFIYLGVGADAWGGEGSLGLQKAGSFYNTNKSNAGVSSSMRGVSRMAATRHMVDDAEYATMSANMGDTIADGGLSAEQEKAIEDARTAASSAAKGTGE